MKTGWGIAYGVVCGLLAAGILFLASRPPKGEAITLMPPPTPAPLMVHVAGDVVQPGVYSIPSGSRVRDAIEAAGGLSAQASAAALNLAAFVEDGAQILVPTKPPTAAPTSLVSTGGGQTSTGNTAPTPVPPSTPGLININTATVEELDSLPGIGPAIAQRIIDYRTENGPFAQIEDIMNVSGIGPATFEKIKDMIVVGP